MHNPPQKHHYIPIFYLKAWAGEDGRLVEFSKPRPGSDVTKPRRVYPAQTGFVNRLYTLRDTPKALENIVEQQLFQPLDSYAAEALKILREKGPNGLSDRIASCWVAFLMSLLSRSEDDIIGIRAMLDMVHLEICHQLALEKDPTNGHLYDEAFAEARIKSSQDVDHIAFEAFPKLIQQPIVNQRILDFRWSVINLSLSKHRRLTSDRPIIQIGNLFRDDGGLMMPISYHQVFFATSSNELRNTVFKSDDDVLARWINKQVVVAARKFAYSQSDRQLKYIAKRLGKNQQTRPISSAYEKARIDHFLGRLLTKVRKSR